MNEYTVTELGKDKEGTVLYEVAINERIIATQVGFSKATSKIEELISSGDTVTEIYMSEKLNPVTVSYDEFIATQQEWRKFDE